MSVKYKQAIFILGEASRGQITMNDNFKESCLMGQRAIGALQLIRNMIDALSKLDSTTLSGIDGIITNALGDIGEDEEGDVNVGPIEDVHRIDDIVRFAASDTPGQWWEVKLRAKIDDDGDLVLEFIILKTPRTKLEEENPR